jgi:curved DNA-binding protein CbpA
MKDYYRILEVTPDSNEEEIRKNYRRLAMLYHPDRNPDKPGAEEKFKEIAEAYGVLTDPGKRQQYDAARAFGANQYHNGSTGGFNYSQDDILRDLFQDPNFQHLFTSLLQEFQHYGFRANEQFVRKSFFGNRKGLFVSGIFLFGSMAGPTLFKKEGNKLPGKHSFLRSLGGAVGSLLSAPKRQNTRNLQHIQEIPQETTYTAYLSAEDLQQGKVIQMVTKGPNGQERLKVKIPKGSKAGQRLRLTGKGLPGPSGRGDLFLNLKEK